MAANNRSDRELLRDAFARTPDCLTLAQLEAVVTDTLTSSARTHLNTCPRCQAEAALLRSFEAAEPGSNEGAGAAWIAAQLDRAMSDRAKTGGRKRQDAPWVLPWFRVAPWRVAVATVVIVIVALVIYWRGTRQPELRASSTRETPVYRSLSIRTLNPRGDVASPAVTFSWEAVPGAAGYVVKVMEVDHVVLWTAKSTVPNVTAPADLQRQVTNGKTLLWQVTAVDVTGADIADSEAVEFRLVANTSGTR